MPRRCLTDLPFDVTVLISKHLLPYDIVALSSVCRALRPLISNSSVWRDVSETLSHARPLPLSSPTLSQLPVSELRSASLRAQAVARRWAQDDVHPAGTPPAQLAFSDRRVVSYLAFLPGTRHLLAFDTASVLSCWSCTGVRLATWDAGPGARLTRWKPTDDADVGEAGSSTQVVEIMIDCLPGGTGLFRSDVVQLSFSASAATFVSLAHLDIPRVYIPVSAWMQDELHGMLTVIDTGNGTPNRLGIYVLDIRTNRAVTIDTGLRAECEPQSLLSPRYMVLYYETRRGARTHTYALSTLRTLLATAGVPQGDAALDTPVPAPPSADTLTPFATVRRASDGVEKPVSLRRNWGWYPIIIPKWPVLREDAAHHRARSVMTLSRRLAHGHAGAIGFMAQTAEFAQAHFDGVIAALNADSGSEDSDGGDDDQHGDGNDVGDNDDDDDDDDDDGFDADLIEDGEIDAGAEDSLLPWTTITHHYFDYNARPQQLKRTVLADVHIRPLPVVRDTFVGDAPGGDGHGELVLVDDDNAFYDPYRGSPVIGYGGKCAIWVEEEMTPDEAAGVAGGDGKGGGTRSHLVIKLVTFPSFGTDDAERCEARDGAPEGEGKVCRLHVPACVDLDKAVCFDLDDSRGVLAVATRKGEVWLIDYH